MVLPLMLMVSFMKQMNLIFGGVVIGIIETLEKSREDSDQDPIL